MAVARIVLKEGVSLVGLRPEALLGIQVAAGCYGNLGCDTVVITAVTDGKHGRGSLHFVGQAFDLRTRGLMPGLVEELAKLLRDSLGAEFDVVLESTHIHVEFQPKELGR